MENQLEVNNTECTRGSTKNHDRVYTLVDDIQDTNQPNKDYSVTKNGNITNSDSTSTTSTSTTSTTTTSINSTPSSSSTTNNNNNNNKILKNNKREEKKDRRDKVNNQTISKEREIEIEIEKMKAGLKIIATGGGYTDPSVMVMSSEKKYVFNAGNGINRQNTKNKIYDSNHIFLTHIDPTTLTDFPNYLLRNKQDISVIGPLNTTHGILAHRYYIARSKKSIHVTECTADIPICFNDGNVKVYPIVLKPTTSGDNDWASPITIETGTEQGSGDNNSNPTSTSHWSILEKASQQLSFYHNSFTNQLSTNSQFKLVTGPGQSQSFFDWTMLRGGMLHTHSGSNKVSTRDIEQYLSYRLMKLETNITKEEMLLFRPTNYRDVKLYLFGSKEEASKLLRSESKQKLQEEFWALESRHFRLIRRISNLPSAISDMSAQAKQDMLRERAERFLSDKVYGPIQSQLLTLEKPSRDLETGMGDVVCYLVLLPDIVGKFDSKKAEKLGVPSGPLRAQLCRGTPVKSITTGEMVKPSDVMSPSTIGPAILVLSCPNASYLQSLIHHPTICSMWNSERSGTVCHMISEELFNHPDYRTFVNRFSGNWTHIVLNEACAHQELTVKSGQMVNGLHGIAPDFFPKLYQLHDALPFQHGSGLDTFTHANNFHRARFQQVVVLNPLAPSNIPLVDNKLCTDGVDTSFSYETRANGEIRVSTESDYGEFDAKTEEMIDRVSREELEVVFFGTGCSQSSDHRDESCIYLDLFNRGGIMFDVGGGSYSQMYRKYGEDVCMRKLSKLKFIFISHLHTDHHQGIQKILAMRHIAMEKLNIPEKDRKIAILAPTGGRTYLQEVEQSLTFGPALWNYVEFYRTANAYDSEDPQVSKLKKFLKDTLAIKRHQTIQVKHSFGSAAIEIESETGWSVAYTGDTSFCEELCTGLKDVTILIHEATFNDSQAQFAKDKSHCTFSDAIRTSEAVNSYRTILTHFSQRYPSLDILDNCSDKNALAFDFLTVNLKDLPRVSHCLDRLKLDPKDVEEDVNLEDFQ